MIGEPQIDDRPERPYIGIRTQVAVHELPTLIPRRIGEVFGWLAQNGVPPAGAPLIRYHTINMPTLLDIEIGVPVAGPVSGTGRVAATSLPAGRYAALVYTGPYGGLLQANAALLDWAAARGLALDRWDAPNGDAFGARVESYLTDPQAEPDASKWQTEVAIRLADRSSA